MGSKNAKKNQQVTHSNKDPFEGESAERSGCSIGN